MADDSGTVLERAEGIDCVVCAGGEPADDHRQRIDTVLTAEPSVPVIVVGGADDFELEGRVLAAGATEYLRSETLRRRPDLLERRILRAAVSARSVDGESRPNRQGSRSWAEFYGSLYEVSSDTDRATLEATGITAVADPNRLRQALENLFRNSVAYAGDEPTIRLGPIDAGGVTGFYVEDDGPGVPQELRESAFEPGTTSNEQGTGLGLSIVEGIATAHGWTVSLVGGSAGVERE